MAYGGNDTVWEYIRPSSSFQNAGNYAPPSTPRVHAFPEVPRTEVTDWKVLSPVGGIGMDICKGRHNPYRGGFASFDLRFTYLREGGHQVSRSPGPGNYDTRHLTGGALVKRPKTPSPCFRRPSGRLDFGSGRTWHKETPLESAERHGTVRGNLKNQPRHYSLSFRSKADRLVVNKPATTTHEGIGPGCYDLSKDGKSVGVRTEKRVSRGGRGRTGSTNQFLVDWRAYVKRPPGLKDGHGCCGGSGSGVRGHKGKRGCNGNLGHAEPTPPSVFPNPPAAPKVAAFVLTRRNEGWPARTDRPRVAVAGRRESSGAGGGEREEEGDGPLRGSGQGSCQKGGPRRQRHHTTEEKAFFPKGQQQQKCGSGRLHSREKRPASAVSLRAPSTVEALALPRRCYDLPGRGSNSSGGVDGSRLETGTALFGSDSWTAVSASPEGISEPPRFVPRPSAVETDPRPRTARAARSERFPQCADVCVGGGKTTVIGTSFPVEDACRTGAPTRTEVSARGAELGGRSGDARAIDGESTSPGQMIDNAADSKAAPVAQNLSDDGSKGKERVREELRPPPALQAEAHRNSTATLATEAKGFHREGNREDVRLNVTGEISFTSKCGAPTAVETELMSVSASTAYHKYDAGVNDVPHIPDYTADSGEESNRVTTAGRSFGIAETHVDLPPSTVVPRAPSGLNVLSPASPGRNTVASETDLPRCLGGTRTSDSAAVANDGKVSRGQISASSFKARTPSGLAAAPATLSAPKTHEPQSALTPQGPSPRHNEMQGISGPSRSPSGNAINGEEAIVSAWRVQSKSSFASVLEIYDRRRSTRHTRSSSGYSSCLGDGNGSIERKESGAIHASGTAPPSRQRCMLFRFREDSSCQPGSMAALCRGGNSLGEMPQLALSDSKMTRQTAISTATTAINDAMSTVAAGSAAGRSSRSHSNASASSRSSRSRPGCDVQ